MKINRIGIDLAKEIIQVYVEDKAGKMVFNKRVKRSNFLNFMTQKVPASIVAMEACGGSHYFARELKKIGHEVLLIAPQYVKPFVKTNKNDMADAEAIAVASRQPNMRFVAIKETWQQDIQVVHRIRSRIIKARVALSNEIRGILLEQGITVNKGKATLLKKIPLILADAENDLSYNFREILSEIFEELKNLFLQTEKYDKKLGQISKDNDLCNRIEKIPGVGTITSTAMLYILGNNAHQFKNGRQFSAYLGLVPRQHSSGGKSKLLGISKRGDNYVRQLLVHGARSVVSVCDKKQDSRSQWISKKINERGSNRACIALANKNARTIWALIKNNSEYKITA
jgi:transposase